MFLSCPHPLSLVPSLHLYSLHHSPSHMHCISTTHLPHPAAARPQRIYLHEVRTHACVYAYATSMCISTCVAKSSECGGAVRVPWLRVKRLGCVFRRSTMLFSAVFSYLSLSILGCGSHLYKRRSFSTRRKMIYQICSARSQAVRTPACGEPLD